MARRYRRKPRQPRGIIMKRHNTLDKRIEAVGPNGFGIVAVDCAKKRSVAALFNFYAKALHEPIRFPHTRTGFESTMICLREQAKKHGLKDVVAAVEMTGRYHRPVKAAFKAAGYDVLQVHPLASSRLRQVEDPGTKTDLTDLYGIFRAALNGLARPGEELDGMWAEWRLLVRHRRDLVEKASKVRIQLRERLEAAMPGYGALFGDLWKSQVAWEVALRYGSAGSICQAGEEGIQRTMREAEVRVQRRSARRILSWAYQAPRCDPGGGIHRQIIRDYLDDLRAKEAAIRLLELDIGSYLVRTSYVLFLCVKGINVVSASDYGAELGPPEHYANPKRITGRAGLYPRRRQSDEMDYPDGCLVKGCNPQLRTALMQIAHNLIANHAYFAGLSRTWEERGLRPMESEVRVASRFSRIGYYMATGNQVFKHPIASGREMILKKLLWFEIERGGDGERTMRDLSKATEQIPREELASELDCLAEARSDGGGGGIRGGARQLREILPHVLARLGCGGPCGEASIDRMRGERARAS